MKRKNLLLLLTSIVLSVAVLELALRLYISTYGREDQKILYLYTREEINTLSSRHQGIPYLNYGLSPNHPQHNALGYRGDEIIMPKPEDAFRIVAVGGSTTYGSGNPRWQEAYPAQLETVLHERGYSQAEVINAGVIRYTSWESLLNVQFRIADLAPGLIIFYEAMNDISPRLVEPAFYSGQNLANGLWNSNDTPVSWSALYRFVAYRFGQAVRYDEFDTLFLRDPSIKTCGGTYQKEGVYWCNQLEIEVDDLLSQNPPIYYERNLRYMVQATRQMNTQLMFVSWAYSPLKYPDDVGGSFFTLPHNQRAVREHNAIVERIATQEDIPFYDFASEISTEASYWVDGMHVNGVGARLQAENFATFIINNIFIRP